MTIDLSSYTNVGSAIIVRIRVDYYKATPTSEPTQEILRFSDYDRNLTIDDEVYLGLGSLVGITSSLSELKSSSSGITITISGIPNSSIAEIINSKIKGAPVTAQRVLFDTRTGNVLPVTGNPVGRFYGIVNNYSLEEQYSLEARTSTNAISLLCTSSIDVLYNKVSGRRTNPSDQKSFYPSDLSMDRVPNLANSNFNFGAPQ